jgi:hypothetical protein
MAKLSKPVMVEWGLSPQQLAKFFCEMNGEEQAEFFNAIGEEVQTWERSLCFQLQGIVDTGKLNGGGIAVMREIGEYAEDYRETLAEAEARRKLLNGEGKEV